MISGSIPHTDGSYHYEYNLKDHLGNTRAVFAGRASGTAEVIQTTNYYPYGLVMEQSNFASYSSDYEKNNYLYNGKELQDEGFDDVSLGLLDYGWRFYDPTILRFTTVDPLSDMYPSTSPYMYVLGNPVHYTDPDGRWVKGAGLFRNLFNSDSKINAENEASKLGGDAVAYKNKGGKGWNVSSTSNEAWPDDLNKGILKSSKTVKNFDKKRKKNNVINTPYIQEQKGGHVVYGDMDGGKTIGSGYKATEKNYGSWDASRKIKHFWEYRNVDDTVETLRLKWSGRKPDTIILKKPMIMNKTKGATLITDTLIIL